MLKKYAVALLCLFSFGQAAAQDAIKTIPPAQRVLSAENGRFVFGQISDFRRDQYLVDTKTGKVWQKVVTKVGETGKEQEVTVFEAIYFVGQDGKWYAEPR